MQVWKVVVAITNIVKKVATFLHLTPLSFAIHFALQEKTCHFRWIYLFLSQSRRVMAYFQSLNMTTLRIRSNRLQRNSFSLFQAHMWTQEQKGALALTSFPSRNREISSALFLRTFPSPQAPAICTLNTVTHAAHVLSQPTTPKSWSVACSKPCLFLEACVVYFLFLCFLWGLFLFLL